MNRGTGAFGLPLWLLAAALATSFPRPAGGQAWDGPRPRESVPGVDLSKGAIFSFHAGQACGSPRRKSGESPLAWVTAAESHHPGKLDGPAQTIANWSIDSLQCVIGAIEKQAHDKGLTQPVWIAGARPESAAKLIEYAIVLHTDIAALAFHSLPDIAADVPGVSVHLGAAMELADFMRLHTWRGQDVSLPASWYRAALALLESEREVAITPEFADRAVSLFPDDPELLPMAGCAREVTASPRVQDAEDAPWVRIRYGSEAKNLPKAVAYYKQALKTAPHSFETHVRLGRVLAQLGEHGEALGQLKAEPDPVSDAEISYFANLFMGQELAATGDGAAARQAYDRAHALFPRARSVHLALSRLDRQESDIEGAVAAVREALNLSVGADPILERYWVAGLARHAGDVLDRFRAQFGAPISTEIKQP